MTEIRKEELPDSMELKAAADRIKAKHDPEVDELGTLIGDSEWFREYLQVCLGFPLGNGFLGAIIFGWQLHDLVIKARADRRVHLA